jgi:hypothetical protein
LDIHSKLHRFAAPLGFTLDGAAPFRSRHVLGDGTRLPSAAVLEAARRLAEFWRMATMGEDGAAFHESERLGDYSRHGRPVNWQARGRSS